MPTAPATTIVLLLTAGATFAAFLNPHLFERWTFKPREILAGHQYERLLTSGFIHVDWWHFAFNAYSFYSFGTAVEAGYGAQALLLIYFASILGGSLLSLFIHRHHDYSAVGASGGVCGIIFACIFLLPGTGVMLFLIPIPIPAFLYAIGFLVFEFVSHRRQRSHIGHDAHLGGAILGLLTATVLYPQLILADLWMFAAVMILSTAILLVLVFDPLHLLERRVARRTRPSGNDRFDRYDEARERNARTAEADRLLDKVASQGIHSLTKAEREELERYAKELNDRR